MSDDVNLDGVLETTRKSMWNGFLDSFVKTQVNCPVHGVQEVMVSKGAKAICPECERKREAQAAKQAEQAKRERELVKRGVPRGFFGATVLNYVPQSESQKAARSCVRKLCEGSLQEVVLLGSNGVGKTHLACAAVKKLGGKWLTVHRLVSRIHATYSRGAQETEQDVLNELAGLPFLAIDELGRHKNSDTVKDWLSVIVDERHDTGLPTMICGNAHLEADCKAGGCDGCFENLVGCDVLSRLQQNSRIVSITDACDWRGRVSRRAQ